jgi:hypothetical protein
MKILKYLTHGSKSRIGPPTTVLQYNLRIPSFIQTYNTNIYILRDDADYGTGWPKKLLTQPILNTYFDKALSKYIKCKQIQKLVK